MSLFIQQAKGMEHCREIKRDAMNFYYLTGGNTKDFKVCIKMALADHVRLLQEETRIMKRLRKEDAPVPAGGEDPF